MNEPDGHGDTSPGNDLQTDIGESRDARNHRELHPAARAIRWVIETVVYRQVYLWGMLLLAVSVAFMSFAWEELSGGTESILDRLSARGTVNLLDTAIRIQTKSGIEEKMDPSRKLWHHDFLYEYVIELRHLSPPQTNVYIRDRSQDFLDIGEFWSVVSQDPMIRTEAFTVKMETALFELMTGTPAQAGSAFRVMDAPRDAPREERYQMGSQFDQFWVWIDWPMHALAVEWMSAGDRTVPIRYDPENPADFLFETTFEKALKTENRTISLVSAGFLAVFGLFTLMFAVSLLTHGMNKYVWTAVYLGVVVMVPAGTPLLQKTIAHLGIPEIGQFFLEEWIHTMDARQRMGFLEKLPAESDREFTVLPVDVEHSRYRALFSYFQPVPETLFHDYSSAMTAISTQIQTRLEGMPSKDQFRFFKLLDNAMAQRRAGWAAPFLAGVQSIALDDNRSKNLRSWAISAFCDMEMDLEDPDLAEFIYNQYLDSSDQVKPYWRSSFWNYFQAPSFAADLNSEDPVRIKRALDLWANDHHFLEDVQFLAPRLKALTRFPDPEIRGMAEKKWNSRTDWETH